MKVLSLITAVLMVAGVASANEHEQAPAATTPAMTGGTEAAAPAKKAEKKKHSKKAKKGEGETH